MARKLASEFRPVRIGATVTNGANLCHGTCGPYHEGQPLHMQPNFRFTLLLLVPVIDQIPEAMPEDSPLIGGPFTPPIRVAALKVQSSRASKELLRLIGWN